MVFQGTGGGLTDRRGFLKGGMLFGAGLALGGVLAATPAEASYGARHVGFRCIHTGESFFGVYRVGDTYLPEAFDRINLVLRDYRTGDVFPIDPRVIDILYHIRRRAGVDASFEVISGYRSPETNAMLRKVSTGVAKKSLHMSGQAVDVRLPDISISTLRDLAVRHAAGGVGYYPRSGFVHMDTGKFRVW